MIPARVLRVEEYGKDSAPHPPLCCPPSGGFIVLGLVERAGWLVASFAAVDAQTSTRTASGGCSSVLALTDDSGTTHPAA